MTHVFKAPKNVLMEFDESTSCYQLIHLPTETVLATRHYEVVRQWTRPGTVMSSVARRALRERGLR